MSGRSLTRRAPQFETTALVLGERVSFEAWAEIGRGTLRSMVGGLQWWAGDWLLYGEAHFGERFAQVADLTGFSPKTMANLMWVANAIAPSRRRERLSWAHHAEVAKLAPAEQTRWLRRAESEGWTRAELRTALRDDDALPHESALAVRAGPRCADCGTPLVCPECGTAAAVERHMSDGGTP